MRGSGSNRRLRYLTHPVAFPSPPAPPRTTEAAATTESIRSDSHLPPNNLYTNMALGNSIQTLMNADGTPNVISLTNDLSQQLAAKSMTTATSTSCQNKSIQNLIREERGTGGGINGGGGIPVPTPTTQQRAAAGYKGSTEDLRGCASGRSSPALYSHSTPNSPPKHLGIGGNLHDRLRAPSPSPLLQVATGAATENRLIDHQLMNFVWFRFVLFCFCFVCFVILLPNHVFVRPQAVKNIAVMCCAELKSNGIELACSRLS